MTNLTQPHPTFGPVASSDRARRRREIALLVTEQGRVTVTELKERFRISGVTARADLDALEGAGNLVRSHGGAVRTASRSTPSLHHALASHAEMNETSGQTAEASDEKTRLAVAALALIQPLETVMLCPGLATREMARLMRDDFTQRATVITYSLPIAAWLSEAAHISLVMLGGFLRHPSGNVVGPHAEQMMTSLHANQCFLNTPGVSLECGLTTADIMEAHLNQRMMDAASQVTLLAELSSFGRRSLARVAQLDRVNRIICDRAAPAKDVEAIRNRGVEVVLV